MRKKYVSKNYRYKKKCILQKFVFMRVHPVSRHHRGAPWLFLKRAAVRNWRLHTFYHKLLQLLPHSPSEIWIDIIKNCSNGSIQQEKYTSWRFTSSELFKGTGHFFETLSLASVPGTDHSQIYAFMINNRFHAEKIHLCASASVVFFCQRRPVYAARVDLSTLAQLQR